MTMYRNHYRTPVALPSLADRDAAVRRASHYPVGSLPTPHISEEECEIAVDHPTALGPVSLPRNARDNQHGRDVTDLVSAVPVAGRPGQNATSIEIENWNAMIKTLPSDELEKFASASRIVRKMMQERRR